MILVDQVFLERRRRGLQRYLIHLMTHPIFQVDPLLKSFLTRSEEMAAYRKMVDLPMTPEPFRLLPINLSQLTDWLSLIVPQLESLFYRYQRLIQSFESIVVRIKEMGREFHLISTTLK